MCALSDQDLPVTAQSLCERASWLRQIPCTAPVAPGKLSGSEQAPRACSPPLFGEKKGDCSFSGVTPGRTIILLFWMLILKAAGDSSWG